MDKEQATMEATNFWDDPRAPGTPVDLLAFIAVFLRRWPFLLLMTFAGLILAAAASFLVTPVFTSHAVFLPPVQTASASDNPLALFLRPPSSSVYLGLLGSDSVLNDVIQHADLQTRFKAKDMDQARQAVRSAIQTSTDTSGFVTLDVTNKDPALAKEIASSFLEALSRLSDRMAISAAAQRRVLFQGEFERAKNDLENSEVELKKAQQASGVVLPETQIRSGLSDIDLAGADIRAKQVALAALLRGETESSPDVQRLRSEINAEQGQLNRLQRGAGSAPGGSLSAADAPSVSLRFIQLQREVKYNQVLFDIMAKQYEDARLQESSAAPAVQVVDYPQVPLHKSKPVRSLFALTGAFLGLCLALALVFLRNRVQVMREDPVHARSLTALRTALRQARIAP